MGPSCAGRGDGVGIGGTGGLREHRAAVPDRVRPGPVVVSGMLSKETIRRVLRRQLNRVRHCYEQGLARRPDLAGRVSVKFLITATGVVQVAAVKDSSLRDPAVEQCIAGVVRQLDFPAPGGVVAVTYPFTLSPAGQ